MHEQKTTIHVENPCSARSNRSLERMTGIEPAFSAWEVKITGLTIAPISLPDRYRFLATNALTDLRSSGAKATTEKATVMGRNLELRTSTSPEPPSGSSLLS